MGSIITLDSLDNGEIPLTAANFPSATALFIAKDLEVGVDTSWVDRISGITVPITALAAATNADDNARDFEIADDSALSSGTWDDLTGKDFLMFVVADYKHSTGNGGLTIGLGTSGIRIRDMITGGAATRVISDGVSPIDVSSAGTLHTKDEVILFGISVDVDGNMVTKDVTAAGGISDIDTTATTNVSDFGGTPASNMMLSDLESIYAFVVFKFDALPADLDSTLLWCYENYKAGNVGLPPNWKDKS